MVLNLFVGASLADFQGDPKLRMFDHGPKPLNSDQTPVLYVFFVYVFLCFLYFIEVFCILVLNLFVGASLADFQRDPKLGIFDHGPKPLNSDQTPVLYFPSSFLYLLDHVLYFTLSFLYFFSLVKHFCSWGRSR